MSDSNPNSMSLSMGNINNSFDPGKTEEKDLQASAMGRLTQLTVPPLNLCSGFFPGQNRLAHTLIPGASNSCVLVSLPRETGENLWPAGQLCDRADTLLALSSGFDQSVKQSLPANQQ